MKIIFIILGLYIGALVDEGSGAVLGGFIGLLAGYVLQFNQRLRSVEQKLKELQSSSTTAEQTAGTVQPVTDQKAEEVVSPPVATPTPGEQARAAVDENDDDDEITLIPHHDDTGEFEVISDEEEVSTLRPGQIRKPPRSAWQDGSGTTDDNPVLNFLRKFFTSGNVVVKVGILILITGISFLLKLAAEHNMFPVELRFICVALLAMVIFFFGRRLRDSRHNYALVLQGGAVGILYITIYVATLKQFSLLPLGLAFGLMFSLVAFSCLLAVLQDAKNLALFAATGGFLAPVLTSSGQGSHVALFSYYALLNAGIFLVAWHKSWRILNWTGFVFTFVIASLWGQKYYQAQYFNTTEPFLILFFLFYVAIAVLFAHRQPPQLKGLVDGSLVFGTPLVGFTLQSALVKDFAYGESISAAVMAAFYVLLAKLLWRKQQEGMRMLSESFLALAVIFASVAIPFALDGRWTAAAWSLEGAGIAWIGIRQNRLFARLFGLLLQAGAAVAFLTEVPSARDATPVFNSACIGMIMISLSALFIGLQFYRNRDRLHAAGREAHIALLIWGLIWWFAAGLLEIDVHVLSRFEMNASLFFIALSTWLLFISGRALHWPIAQQLTVLFLPVMVLFALVRFVNTPLLNPFAYFGYAAWIMAFIVQYGLLYRAESSWNKNIMACWHAITLWLYVFIATWVIANAVVFYVSGLHGWNRILWGLLPVIAVFKLLYLRNKFAWPIPRYQRSYLAEGMLPMATYLAAWVVVNCFDRGDPSPLIYIPVINPQDIVQILAMLAIGDWLLKWRKGEVPAIARLDPMHGFMILGLVAFAWLNSLVAQSVHFYAHIPHEMDTMFRAELFQTSISIVWTLTAFAMMGFATRKALRRIWFAGVVLLAAVVIKLFTIDLADSGTIARIVSFLTVGILMLIIGYYSPIPPRKETEKSSA